MPQQLTAQEQAQLAGMTPQQQQQFLAARGYAPEEIASLAAGATPTGPFGGGGGPGQGGFGGGTGTGFDLTNLLERMVPQVSQGIQGFEQIAGDPNRSPFAQDLASIAAAPLQYTQAVGESLGGIGSAIGNYFAGPSGPQIGAQGPAGPPPGAVTSAFGRAIQQQQQQGQTAGSTINIPGASSPFRSPPQRELPPPIDLTKFDEAQELARPQPLDQARIDKLKKAGRLQGFARGLREGASAKTVGGFLATLGGATVEGVAQSVQQIEGLKLQHDKEALEFQQFIARGELEKAKLLQTQDQQRIAVEYTNQQARWQHELAEHEQQQPKVQVSGGIVFVQTTDPETGDIQLQTHDVALARAQLRARTGGQQSQSGKAINGITGAESSSDVSMLVPTMFFEMYGGPNALLSLGVLTQEEYDALNGAVATGMAGVATSQIVGNERTEMLVNGFTAELAGNYLDPEARRDDIYDAMTALIIRGISPELSAEAQPTP